MDKEFIHNLEDGCYYVLDVLKQKVLLTNSRGKFVTEFKPSISGVSRRQIKMKNNQSISYTPHQNKYFGYCQCPNEKVKHSSISKEQINIFSTQEIPQTRNYLPKNKVNCFNKPKTPKLQLPQTNELQRIRISDISFDHQNQSHLSGTINDAKETYKSGTIQCLQYRKGTQQIDKMIQLQNQESDNLRYTCRYVNGKKVKSPPFALLQKYDVIGKINNETKLKMERSKDDNLIKRITNHTRQQTRISSNRYSQYKNLDVSLNDSVESQKIKAYLSQR